MFRALARLPRGEREALLLVGVGEVGHGDAALALNMVMAVLVAIGGVGYSVWQSSVRGTETVAVLQSADDLVLVVTPDGRQWVLGPSRPASAPGTMELLIEGGP